MGGWIAGLSSFTYYGKANLKSPDTTKCITEVTEIKKIMTADADKELIKLCGDFWGA